MAPGDRLVTGQPMARAGNSGNTSEPHLHIHAVDPTNGNGVPLTLAGLTSSRNRVLKVDG